MSAPSDVATNTGTNNADNFERIDINNPSGTYTITVTHKGSLVNGSQNFSLIATAPTLSTLGTGEVKEGEKVNFYPNPAKDYIYINEKENNIMVTIHDISGKIISRSALVNNKLNISSLTTGNYIVTYTTKNGTKKSFKFIKE